MIRLESVPRQSTDVAKIPSIPVNPSVSYANVAKNSNSNSSKSDVLSQILEKLNKQEDFNKLLEKRMTKLEQNLKSLR